MNDTQSMARQRGGGGGGGSGYNHNMDQYNGPPSNNYNSYGRGGNNYQMGGGSGGNGMKRKIEENKEINFNKKSIF